MLRVFLGVVLGVVVFTVMPTQTYDMNPAHVPSVILAAAAAGAVARRFPVYVGIACWAVNSALTLYLLVAYESSGAPRFSSLPHVAQALELLRFIAMAPLWVLGAWAGSHLNGRIRTWAAESSATNAEATNMEKTRSTRKRSAVVLLLACLGWLAVIFYSYQWVYVALAMSGYVADTTKYAEHYTEEGFEKVDVGMDEAAVRRAIGAPLEVRQKSAIRVVWIYSSKGPYGWRIRAVEFVDGRVIRKKAKWLPG